VIFLFLYCDVEVLVVVFVCLSVCLFVLNFAVGLFFCLREE